MGVRIHSLLINPRACSKPSSKRYRSEDNDRDNGDVDRRDYHATTITTTTIKTTTIIGIMPSTIITGCLHAPCRMSANPSATIDAAMQSWEPVVDLPFNENEVARTIEDFGRCVDAIEDGNFEPPPAEELGNRAAHDAARTTKQFWEHARSRRRLLLKCTAGIVMPDSLASRGTRNLKLREGRSRDRWASSKREEEVERELDAWIEENLVET